MVKTKEYGSCMLQDYFSSVMLEVFIFLDRICGEIFLDRMYNLLNKKAFVTDPFGGRGAGFPGALRLRIGVSGIRVCRFDPGSGALCDES
jgi:hypothetical protein